MLKQDVNNKTQDHTQKDIKIRKQTKRNRSRQKRKDLVRKNNTSSSTAKRTKLTSKERKNSMKRLGITNQLEKKVPPPSSVQEEKERIQDFLEQFFQSDANANKFSEAEKRKFSKNFQKAFIQNKLGNFPAPKKPAGTKLKALPAPPAVKKAVEQKGPKKQILPSLDPMPELKVNEDEQKIGCVKMYNNAFAKNNFNFVAKPQSFDSESGYDQNSYNKELNDEYESTDKKYSKDMDSKYSSDSNNIIRMNYNFAERMKQEFDDQYNYATDDINQTSAAPEKTHEKVSATFGESLPVLASFVNMYGKSFANVRK